MKERYKSLPRAQKIASLEQALNYIAEMVQTREDGDLYIGQFESYFIRQSFLGPPRDMREGCRRVKGGSVWRFRAARVSQSG